MNDNDLIRRGDALRAAVGWLFDAKRTEDLVERLRSVPAAELEMTAKEYVKAHKRLCDMYPIGNGGCKECPLFEYDCNISISLTVDEYLEMEEVIEAWAREHPEGVANE